MLAGRLLLTAAQRGGRGGGGGVGESDGGDRTEIVSQLKVIYHILSHTNCHSSLTVSIAGKAIHLMQPGVRFAHGVQFWMSKGTLLSHTHGQVNTGIKHANIKHVCASVYTTSYNREKGYMERSRRRYSWKGGWGREGVK